MATLQELGAEIRELKVRNARVEADKAWETSIARKAILAIFTYLAIGFYLQAIEIPYPWENALVPSLAFMLSTLTLPFFKKVWLKHVRK